MKRWCVKLGLVAGLLLFLVLNVLAFFQAWRMTHFCASGQRTGSPIQLSAFEKVIVLMGGVTIPRPVVRSCQLRVSATEPDGPFLDARWRQSGGVGHPLA